MFLPDRYIKGECPNCGAKDQYGDACEICGSVYAPTELKNPYSTLSGATPVLQVRALLLPALRSEVHRLPAAVAGRTPGRLQPEVVEQGAANGSTASGDKALRDWDISRDAPYFGIRDSRTRRASTSTSGSTRRSATSPRSRTTCAQRPRRCDFDAFLADPAGRADPLHRQGHHLLPHAVLAGDAAVRAAARCPTTSTCTASSRVSGEKMSQVARHRHLAAALPRARHEPGVAALLHRRQAQRATSRTSTSTPTTSSPASTATWSASTSTSPAAARASSTASASAASSADFGTRAAARRAAQAQAQREIAALLRGARVRQGAARDHGARRPRQPVRRRAQALGARQGGRRATRGCTRSARSRINALPPADDLPEAGAAAARRAGRALPARAAAARGATPATLLPAGASRSANTGT